MTQTLLNRFLSPLVPAKAGTQGQVHGPCDAALDSRFRGNERCVTFAPRPYFIPSFLLAAST